MSNPSKDKGKDTDAWNEAFLILPDIAIEAPARSKTFFTTKPPQLKENAELANVRLLSRGSQGRIIKQYETNVASIKQAILPKGMETRHGDLFLV